MKLVPRPFFDSMSDSFKNLLSTQPHNQILREYSGLEIYFLPELSAYLKIGEIRKNSNLSWERKVLAWLSGKTNIPNILGFEVSNEREYLLISEIHGQTYSDQLAASNEICDVERLAEVVATHIRRIHDLAIEENIDGGFVDESDFDQENLGKTARQVFDELLGFLPLNEDLVFTHGDLCLPNIIIQDGGNVGFIDFDRGGVEDRYQDIALFLRSFRFNSSKSEDITSAFCRGYGISGLDKSKLDFYRKLDELF